MVPRPVLVRPLFVGAGSICACADWNGVYRWDLFGQFTKLVDWPAYQNGRMASCNSMAN